VQAVVQALRESVHSDVAAPNPDHALDEPHTALAVTVPTAHHDGLIV
jgi:hypothetical protein